MSELPVAFTAWISAATCGPTLGPALSIYGVALTKMMPMYGLLIVSMACLGLMLIALPETLPAKLAQGTVGHVKHRSRDPQVGICQMAAKTLCRPLRLMITNAAIFFANLYTCLMYAIYYSFFESFPQVYLQYHKFSYKQLGLAFLAIALGAVLGILPYLLCARWWRKNFHALDEHSRPERCLEPALFASVLVSTGLFIFAMTAKSDFSWYWSLTGVVVETAGVVIVLQCLANYLLLAYPSDAASLLAGNDLMRSIFAAGSILLSPSIYDHLGPQLAVFILACTTAGCALGMLAMYLCGHDLRSEYLGTVMEEVSAVTGPRSIG
ncbi:hypothetical protein CAC42_376 [Sphaceloma murrayae]|uniref:Uncharacterized protein n=1 Tax=Sphaceloma murrayae TaxID=2082308 RepID=A0A2K1R3C8_9PEZI|nr:hypothetical protein CAC42_376 [Sphaceloma murrayae]